MRNHGRAGGRKHVRAVGVRGGRAWASAGRRKSERLGRAEPAGNSMGWHKNKRGTSGTSAGASALGTQAPPMPALSCIDKGVGGNEGGTSLVHATGFNLGKSPMRSAMCMGTGRLAQV